MVTNWKEQLKTLDGRIEALRQRLEIKNPRLRSLFSIGLFLLLLHGLYVHIGVYRFIHERPCSIHASAQCQRASVAQNYYNVDMNFFKPRIQRFVSGDGVTGLEFPIIYYTAAVLYKWFGFNDSYLRIISLVIATAGFLLFFMLAKMLLKSNLLALTAVFAGLLSPVLLYYSANIMPDVPALALTLCGWYFFFRYLSTSSNKDLWLFVGLAALGGLIKAVSLMCFAVVIGLLVLDLLKAFKNEDRIYLFQKKGKVFLAVLAGIATVYAWYYYAGWLSRANGNGGFTLGPALVKDMEGVRDVFYVMRNTWLFQYYSYETYVLLISAVVVILLNLKHTSRLLITITLLYVFGSLSYAYLFLFQFMNHDYYMIAILPVAFFLILTLADIVRKLSLRYSQLIAGVFLVIMVFNLKECLVNCKENYFFRYDSKVYLGGDYRSYYDIAPRLKALGITRKDMFVSAFDDSYTNSLYFMDQPGFTVEGCYERDTIQHALDVPGVKYLIVSDSAKFNSIYRKNLSKNIVLVHRGLIVYKLK